MEFENKNEMLQIRQEKLDQLIEKGEDPHKITHFTDRTLAKTIIENFEDFEEKTVRVAGRIMSKRGHGKVNFMDIQDSSGRIQFFNKMNNFGEEEYEKIKQLDVGDIVGAEGEIFKTKTGETSVRTKSLTLLTKSLQILPEKFHGLNERIGLSR